jgi:hypothetical protein
VNIKELKLSLNLERFTYIYIQKVLGIIMPIYIITINSRYPSKFIAYRRLNSSMVSQAYSMNLLNLEKVKLTPPVLLSNFQGTIYENSYIVVRDIGAEDLLTKRNLIPYNIKKLRSLKNDFTESHNKVLI